MIPGFLAPPQQAYLVQQGTRLGYTRAEWFQWYSRWNLDSWADWCSEESTWNTQAWKIWMAPYTAISWVKWAFYG